MRDDLPAGTVTLLFSDIEGSTRLLRQMGDRYIIVLTECRHILRSAFQQCNGYEVDTEGDACFAVFVRASDGIAAAVTAGHAGWVRAVKWSPDGRHIASTSEDKTVQLWNSSTGQTPVSYHGHADWVSTMAWSPDGKHMASASRDNIVHVWDTTTGSSRMTFHDHADTVHALTWLPDGKHIASVSGDRTMKVWRVK